ncbi:SH2 domain-containing adapter protein F isoform 2-T2 [Discoglossus pictus]
MLLSGHSSASSAQQTSDTTRSVPTRSSLTSRGSPPPSASTGQQCAGSMAKWIKEHLGFKSSKPPPPAPPKPDYRQCQAGGGTTHHHHHHHHHPTAPQYPATPAGQPDILTAYKLQKERDFEDPYTTSGLAGSCASLNSSITPTAPVSSTAQSPSSPSPDVKYVSPKHRLIKVDTGDKGGSSPTSSTNPGGSSNPSGGAPGIKSPPATSVPPQTEDSKQDKVIILEDYADPFDAKEVPGSQNAPEKVSENDGYMEPYEAQKMMEEIRRRGSKELPSKPLHLYDTPYEPTENGLDAEGEKSTCQRPRESRLPQDDERPPEEYDQPWEWKKDRISKAFAVGQLDSTTANQESDVGTSYTQQPQPSSPQLQSQSSLEDNNAQYDGADKPGMSPSKEDKLRHTHRHSAGNLKAIKHPSVEHTNSVGERIDPSLPLESQFWYHGAISRTDAEGLLRLCKEASYLVRNGETSKIDFSLSLKSNQGFMHMKLSRTKENKYVLGQNSPPFESVPEIIHYYTSRKLPIKGAEHMSLLYPVAIRTL